jgi:hypothetical protein
VGRVRDERKFVFEFSHISALLSPLLSAPGAYFLLALSAAL